tara:strand:- start:12 stop:377 length:366 start_codon:yes stop_codon:yes gene_type:complete
MTRKIQTKSYQNIPRRNSAAEQDWNPVNERALSTSNTGIVSFSAGNVYYDFNNNVAEKGELWFKVLIRDEYDNLTDMLRSSNIDDTTTQGSYVSNQTIRDTPYKRLGRLDGIINKNTEPVI